MFSQTGTKLPKEGSVTLEQATQRDGGLSSLASFQGLDGESCVWPDLLLVIVLFQLAGWTK